MWSTKLGGVHLVSQDYNSTTEDVYKRAAIAAFKHDNSLRLVSGFTGFSKYYTLPWWVPNLLDSKAITAIKYWEAYNAGGDRTLEYNYLSDD